MAASLITFTGCVEESSYIPTGNELRFPAERVLTNKSGATLEATLLGRSSTVVALRKKDNPAVYHYAISDLAPEDAAFVLSLPPSRLPDVTVPPEKKDSFVTSREEELKRLLDEMKELDARAGSGSTIQKNTAASELLRVRQKIAKLKDELRSYEELQAFGRRPARQ